jgi:hypothetical protein
MLVVKPLNGHLNLNLSLEDEIATEDIIVRNGRTYLDITKAFNMYFSEIELISQLLNLKQKNWKSAMDALNEKIKSKEL